MAFESWGRFPKIEQSRQHAIGYHWITEPFPRVPEGQSVLAHGQGRSYGDSCLNEGNALIPTGRLNRFIAFDGDGRLRCEAGVTLAEILEVSVPRGFFLPVSPGTKFVSVGGAIANDIHGKNHHARGTFGRFVTRMELLRSDGSRHTLSPTENPELFRATIGGLGLTGLITWAELTLLPIRSAFIDEEVIRFGDTSEFFALSKESQNFEYTVAWVDCLASGKRSGRGHFIRGNHADTGGYAGPRQKKASVPFDFPAWALSSTSMRLFNGCYYRKPCGKRRVHYDAFFYPLDAIHHWNRIYGRRGFVQYQLVVPYDRDDGAAVREVLAVTAKEGLGSFLAVMKTFGEIPSPGLLSFPRPGVTLTLDFPASERVLKVLEALDAIVMGAGGALYPAKDARMSRETFRRSFPKLEEFSRFVDPRFSSSFWRRVN